LSVAAVIPAGQLQDVAAGNEVLISYLGSKPDKNNRQLMKDYGFALPGNTNDLIAFEQTGVSRCWLAYADYCIVP
jgi:hypothetical protein